MAHTSKIGLSRQHPGFCNKYEKRLITERKYNDIDSCYVLSLEVTVCSFLTKNNTAPIGTKSVKRSSK